MLALGMGLALSLFDAVVVPLATTPLFGAETTQLFRLFSPSFLLVAIMIVPLAQLQRELRFRRIGTIQVCGVLASAAASLGLAFARPRGEGVRARHAHRPAALAVGYQASVPLTLPRWHRREAREIRRFGVPAAAAGLAGIGYRNVDYIVIGGRLGPLMAGYYYRAYTLGVEYEAKLTGVLARVTFPLYSRTGGPRPPAQPAAAHRAPQRDPRLAAAGLLHRHRAGRRALDLRRALGARRRAGPVPGRRGMASTLRNGTSPLILAAGHPRALLGFCASRPWRTRGPCGRRPSRV